MYLCVNKTKKLTVMITKKIAKKAAPLKMGGLYGAEGKALITKNADGFRQDDVFPSLEIIQGAAFTEKFGKTKKGWKKGIVSNGVLVNLVGEGYGVLPNIDFFGEIENKLLECDVKTMVRAINRDDSAFAVEHILSDDRYVVNVKNGMDKISPMLSFTTSYDGSTKTSGSFGYHRRVCDNGLHVSSTEIGFNMKHRGNIIEVVIPEIDLLIQKFMDNEFFSLNRKFEVLAETTIKNLGDYVKLVIMYIEKSEENIRCEKCGEVTDSLGFCHNYKCEKERKKPIIVHLDVYSFEGISIGATHYYGKLICKDERIELKRKLNKRNISDFKKENYLLGHTTNRFNSEKHIINAAKKIWKKLFPSADVLLLGSSSIVDPQKCLAGNPIIKRKIPQSVGF